MQPYIHLRYFRYSLPGRFLGIMLNMTKNIVRSLLRLFGRLIEIFLTRTRVTGLENIPTSGAYIFAGNHASTYDPVLLMNHLPAEVTAVGPGDFKLLFPANLLIEYLGIIRIQRGGADKDSLKQMMDVLKDGRMLMLFPEGGTWEKRLEDVKAGAAYLSLMTGAPVIPVAIGGTYQVWRKIFSFQRPEITLHFAPPMLPVVNTDRRKRQDDLRQHSLAMMQIIYQHLPAAEQARYDLYARQQFSGTVEFAPAIIATEAKFPVLAELISKPNLFSPLHQNLQLPVLPLRQIARFYPAADFITAAEALQDAFKTTVPGYINYRLGDRKAQAITGELEKLKALAEEAHLQRVAMRFQPQVVVLDHPLPANE